MVSEVKKRRIIISERFLSSILRIDAFEGSPIEYVLNDSRRKQLRDTCRKRNMGKSNQNISKSIQKVGVQSRDQTDNHRKIEAHKVIVKAQPAKKRRRSGRKKIEHFE